MQPIKRIPITEFVSEGYLQELNRQFLHPLGLALEIVREEDGTMQLGGVWDYRADPEGMLFADESLATDEARFKAVNVAAKRALKRRYRVRQFGFNVQPLPPAVAADRE